MSVSAVYLPDFAHQQSLLGPKGTKRKGSCHELSPRAVRRFPRMAGPAAAGLAGAAARLALAAAGGLAGSAGLARPATGLARPARAGQLPRLGDPDNSPVLSPARDRVDRVLHQALWAVVPRAVCRSPGGGRGR